MTDKQKSITAKALLALTEAGDDNFHHFLLNPGDDLIFGWPQEEAQMAPIYGMSCDLRRPSHSLKHQLIGLMIEIKSLIFFRN